MRKLILLLGLIVLSCSVESEFEIQELNSDLSGISIKGSKNDKITICHFDADNNEWKTLNISQNAIPAHLNHGDAIDADGDGFFDRENGCSPVDCDDDDSEVGECPTFDLEDGLIAWYPFNGNANDESGNGNDGAVIGANLISDRFGKPQSAYDFETENITRNGSSSQRIEIGQILLSQQYSFNIWINPESYYWPGNVEKSAQVFNYDNLNCSLTGTFQLDITSLNTLGETRFISFNEEAFSTSSNSTTTLLNQWQMITGVATNEAVILYQNGIEIGRSETPGQNLIYEGCLVLGAQTSGGGYYYYYDGLMDDFGIWSRVLTDDEIQALYNETDSDLTN